MNKFSHSVEYNIRKSRIYSSMKSNHKLKGDSSNFMFIHKFERNFQQRDASFVRSVKRATNRASIQSFLFGFFYWNFFLFFSVSLRISAFSIHSLTHFHFLIHNESNLLKILDISISFLPFLFILFL